ncbi:hypothetical protein [Pseudooceanicola nanhaiensis]|jgi:hypothetical protein|nr:hypothetical protein [Pseudooceanicola nanhaiensis]
MSRFAILIVCLSALVATAPSHEQPAGTRSGVPSGQGPERIAARLP